MKNQLIKSFFFVVITIGLIACGQDEALTPNPTFSGENNGGSSNTNTSGSGTITADVGGVAWSGATVSASRISGVINVTGIASDQSSITLTLIDKGEGTYDIDGAADGNASYQVTFSETYVAGSFPGEVVLTEINTSAKTMSGTFKFTGENGFSANNDTINVTNGVFTNVPFQTELTSTGGTNELKATVDGTVFTASTITGLVDPLLGNLVINGSDNMAAETIGITIPPDIMPGTYMFGTLGSTYYAQYNRSTTEFFESQNGQLVISKHDVTAKEIEGTFNFNASTIGNQDSVVVTAGEFKATY